MCPAAGYATYLHILFSTHYRLRQKDHIYLEKFFILIFVHGVTVACPNKSENILALCGSDTKSNLFGFKMYENRTYYSPVSNQTQ
jgi:hypothetical protein